MLDNVLVDACRGTIYEHNLLDSRIPGNCADPIAVGATPDCLAIRVEVRR